MLWISYIAILLMITISLNVSIYCNQLDYNNTGGALAQSSNYNWTTKYDLNTQLRYLIEFDPTSLNDSIPTGPINFMGHTCILMANIIGVTAALFSQIFSIQPKTIGLKQNHLLIR